MTRGERRFQAGLMSKPEICRGMFIESKPAREESDRRWRDSRTELSTRIVLWAKGLRCVESELSMSGTRYRDEQVAIFR